MNEAGDLVTQDMEKAEALNAFFASQFLIIATGRNAWRLQESKCHSYIQKGHEGELRELEASQIHIDLWKGDGAINLGKHFRHMNDKKVITSSLCAFTKGKSCLTPLANLYD